MAKGDLFQVQYVKIHQRNTLLVSSLVHQRLKKKSSMTIEIDAEEKNLTKCKNLNHLCKAGIKENIFNFITKSILKNPK